jgi:hypothetical protein
VPAEAYDPIDHHRLCCQSLSTRPDALISELFDPMENNMKKLTVLLIAVFAIAGLSLTAGCKSDCEKALANFEDLYEKKIDGEKRDKMLKKCDAWDDSKKSCMAKASSKSDFKKCD